MIRHRFGHGRPMACLMAASVVLLLSACKKNEQGETAVPRPVRTVTVEPTTAGDTVTLTGHVEAQDSSNVAFRISGRMIERFVNVGDQVEPGQELARLDPQNELNALRASQAQLNAAQAALTQARSEFQRQRTLLAQGHTPRAQFEVAERALHTAQANVDAAEVQVRIDADRVSYTVLQADAAGSITARGAEPGEVVQAGQMIVTIARKDGRDAVFDVPAQVLRSAPSDPRIVVHLADDPSVTARGWVREIAPQADPVTRTFAVRIALTDVPPAMRLGATVNGQLRLEADQVIAIPASALTELDRKPAVWIVDPKTLSVSLRNIEAVSFSQASVTVAHGLQPGDIVVTAGIQALHPGQKVRLLEPST